MKNKKCVPDSDAFASDQQAGLTKREYFAAMALCGVVSKLGWTDEEAACYAVHCADALIDELNRTAS